MASPKKSVVTAFVSALFSAAFFITSAFAATPVAVWDGDFTATQSGFTLNRCGNAISADNSTITIDQDVGVKVDFATGFSTAMTVMFKYSDLAFDAQKTLATSFCSGGDENRTGVYAASGGTINGIWNTADWGNASQTLSKSSGVLAFCYHKSNGTSLYYISADGTRAELFNKSGLKASGDTAINGCTIGGERAKSGATLLSAATGMKITGIAIFDGILTEAEMSDYFFPSDIDTIAVGADTTASAINALLAASSGKKIVLSVTSGVTISVDTAFVASVPVEVASTGDITLTAGTQPDPSWFSKVDFSGVQGAVFRSWLPTPGVVGFNFNANGGRNGEGNTDGAADTALALEIGTWYKDAYSPSGSSTSMFADGISKLTWQANNVYAESGGLTSGTFIQGYLDDGGGVTISLSCVPYASYDLIIYCSTDTAESKFSAKTVNGVYYAWDSTAGNVVEVGEITESAAWGDSSLAAGKAVYGANTIRINGLSGKLAINSRRVGGRGCIAAIQIMPAGTSTAPEMTVGTAGQTTQATWTGASWNVATAPTSGNVIINVAGNVELTVDATVELSAITVAGEGSLKLILGNNVTLTASSISSALPLLFANDGISIDTISASVTYLYTVASVASSLYGNTYVHGAGAVSGTTTNAVAISHNGGSALLDGTDGTPFYLQASDNGTATTVVMTNVTANYTTSLGVGAASYTVAGQSIVNAGVNAGNPQSFVLSQGGAGRASTFLLKDTSAVNVAGTSDVDSNQAAIMFGHWNGPSTFTIQDSAAFNAVCDVLVGKTANNHTININGGTFTAKGIKASAGATGTNVLNLNGGKLVLGTSGISSYGSSTTISVNVNGTSEICASAAELPISQGITIASAACLSLTKSEGVSEAVVALSSTANGDGSVSVAEGVTLKLGTIRPSWTFAVDGTLAVTLANKVEVIALNATKQPADVVLYDVDGTTVISNAKVSYDGGTIRVASSNLVWANTLGDGNFDSEGNWDAHELPGDSGTDDVVVNVSGETPITVSSDYVVDEFSVAGGGTASFSGDGSVAANAAYVLGGSTLDTNGRVTFQNLSLESSSTGIVTSADGLTNGGLTGAGTFVIDPGAGVTKTMSSANTLFTGEAVIASGTVKMGDENSFGSLPPTSSIRVKSGATLDANGVTSVYYSEGKTKNHATLEAGAVFTSSVVTKNGGGNEDKQFAAFSALTLLGDATVDASVVMVPLALRYHWDYVKICLNEHTLIKTGDKDFFISTAHIMGTGVFDVRRGSVTICNDWYNYSPAKFPDGTLKLASGTTFRIEDYNSKKASFTVKNLELNGEVTRTSDNVLTVTGYITGRGTTPMLTLAEGAVFKPTGNGYLRVTESLTVEGGTMTIDISEIDFASRTSVPLFRVGSAEMLPEQITIAGGLPEGWELAKLPSGLGYKLRKPIGLIFGLR